MLKQKRSFFKFILLLFSATFLLFGCANRQLPQGGPRDLTPPKLLKASPPDMTRNFKAKEIELEFDEFFKLTNQYQEITLSPAMEKQPEYKTNKKKLVIEFKDSLQKNTTYVINFGKAVADVNESNVLKNFTYVFSTGSHIDSLSLSGTVSNTQTQEHEKDVTVFLFPLKDDSLLFGKKKPTIYTTTDSAGNFTLGNLHDGDYRIYALKEGSPNKILDNDNELIAFSKKVIHLNKDTANIALALFKQTPEKFRLSERRFDPDGKMSFLFNKRLTKPSVKIVYPPALDRQKIVEISKTKDTATIFMRNMDFDSIRVAFFDGTKALDSVSLRKGRKESFSRNLSFEYSTSYDNKLRPSEVLRFKARYPIESFEPSLITMKDDSTDTNNFTVVRDTGNTRLFTLNYKWKQNNNYTLTFNEGAFTDIYGGKNKKIIKKFTLDKPDNYSTLTLKMQVPDTSKAYVVEVLNEQKAPINSSTITKNTALQFKNFLTGKYTIRVIYDQNRNGYWDSGNVKQKLQPENIWLDETLITLRPNWDDEHTIVIPKEPVTP